MKLLADAHISREMVAFLRDQGHDLMHVADIRPRMTDAEILRLARDDLRVVLTADKDFGGLVFRQGLASAGVVLIRFTVPSERERMALFRRYWPAVEAGVAGHFVVVNNRSVRRRPLPARPLGST